MTAVAPGTGPGDSGEGRPTDPEGPTGTLADWIAGVRDDDIPEAVRRRAAHLLLDGIGCGLVGAQLPWSRTAAEALLSVEEPSSHCLIGWDRRVSSHAAVVLNSTFIQGFELDDYHPDAPLHSASLVLPALLATGEDLGDVTGRRLLTAAIVGCEVGPRAGLALHGRQMLSRGWHSGAVFGPHAAAAAAGHLRGLRADQQEDALGLAGTQSGGLMAAQFEAMSKRMHHGFAARAGYHAALFAAHGYTGIKRVFEREYGGWLAMFGEGHDPDPTQIADELGARWETERIAFKPYAAMGGLQAAIEGTLAAVHEGLDVSTIERIDISVGHAVYHHGWWPPERPLTAIGAQMNIGFVVAAALVDGQLLAQQYAAERLDDDAIWRLIDRVHVHLDEDFDAPDGPGGFTTDLSFTAADGSRWHRRVLTPPGGRGRPLSNESLRDKFFALTEGIVSTPRQKRIAGLVLGLDDDGPLGELLEALSGEVHPILT
jgi:2-methylcitrate dehydratase PrpD